MKQQVYVLSLIFLLVGCNTPSAMVRGSELTFDCMVSNRYCTAGLDNIIQVYYGVTPQQVLNATQQVWIEQGYDVSAALLTQQPSQHGKADGSFVKSTLYHYGDAQRYFAPGQGLGNEGDCFWQRVRVGISQDDATIDGQSNRPVTVHWGASVKECNDTAYGYGDKTPQSMIDSYNRDQGFVKSQKSVRYAQDFHKRLANKLGVIGRTK